jgi:hypothetical protein
MFFKLVQFSTELDPLKPNSSLASFAGLTSHSYSGGKLFFRIALSSLCGKSVSKFPLPPCQLADRLQKMDGES